VVVAEEVVVAAVAVAVAVVVIVIIIVAIHLMNVEVTVAVIGEVIAEITVDVLRKSIFFYFTFMIH
jgi:hypothetical protein